jgi:hypothetical protein
MLLEYLSKPNGGHPAALDDFLKSYISLPNRTGEELAIAVLDESPMSEGKNFVDYFNELLIENRPFVLNLGKKYFGDPFSIPTDLAQAK